MHSFPVRVPLEQAPTNCGVSPPHPNSPAALELIEYHFHMKQQLDFNYIAIYWPQCCDYSSRLLFTGKPMSSLELGRHPGEPQLGGQEAPSYQDSGDNQGGIEETVGYVGGVEAAVHAEAVRHVPLANLRRPRRKDWEEMEEGGVWGAGLLKSCRFPGLEGAASG